MKHLQRQRDKWVDSLFLTKKIYGEDERAWPLNARLIVTVAMRSVKRKLDYHKSSDLIVAQGGGRAGVEYMLKERR